MKHILVCTDGSRLSQKAVKAAVLLARDLGAHLTAYHAMEPFPVMPDPEYAAVLIAVRPDEWERIQSAGAQAILEKCEAMAAKAGVPYSSRFDSPASPHEGIVAAARKAKCDLIVMASHGRHGIRGLLLGSETNKVLTHSKIPVLVYR